MTRSGELINDRPRIQTRRQDCSLWALNHYSLFKVHLQEIRCIPQSSAKLLSQHRQWKLPYLPLGGDVPTAKVFQWLKHGLISFGLQQQKSIISEVWRPEVQTQGAGGAMLPGGSKGIFLLASLVSSSSWQYRLFLFCFSPFPPVTTYCFCTKRTPVTVLRTEHFQYQKVAHLSNVSFKPCTNSHSHGFIS